jgi:hypothetical protein
MAICVDSLLLVMKDEGMSGAAFVAGRRAARLSPDIPKTYIMSQNTYFIHAFKDGIVYLYVSLNFKPHVHG